MEYPVSSFILVLEDSNGNRVTQTSPSISGSSVNIVIGGLRENTHYSYFLIVSNQFGNYTSLPVENLICT